MSHDDALEHGADSHVTCVWFFLVPPPRTLSFRQSTIFLHNRQAARSVHVRSPPSMSGLKSVISHIIGPSLIRSSALNSPSYGFSSTFLGRPFLPDAVFGILEIGGFVGPGVGVCVVACVVAWTSLGGSRPFPFSRGPPPSAAEGGLSSPLFLFGVSGRVASVSTLTGNSSVFSDLCGLSVPRLS